MGIGCEWEKPELCPMGESSFAGTLVEVRTDRCFLFAVLKQFWRFFRLLP